MKKLFTTGTTSILFTLLTFTSCGAGGKTAVVEDALKSCPVVGTYVQVGDSKVLSCDQKLLTETIRLPLSFFTEEMDIIKLDNQEVALVGDAAITISDNHILVHKQQSIPFKLFDRKGNFITNIGAIGQGPGEYQNIYDVQVDEPNNRIYLMPWQSASLLVYDLKGNILDPIPLCLRCPKAKFRVNSKNETLSVVLLPFEGLPAVAWTQDLKGNRQSFIEPGHLVVPPDFSNEVLSFFNMPDVFDVNILSIMPTRVDSLYRYDTANNRLIPTFTINVTNTDNIPWHSYVEWPDHFVGNTSIPVEERPGMMVNGETAFYIVEKSTCKGAYFTLYNDFFGNQDIAWPYAAFTNGYYSRSIEPGNLLTDIESTLKNPDITDAMRKKLTDLQNSINENDNNYVMIAKLRK